MFRTGAQFMMLVLLAGLALLRESRHEPLSWWDNAFTDFLAMHSRHGAKPAPVTGKQNVGITRAEPVGRYAVRIVFDDGHDTGLYSWDLLYELGRDKDAKFAAYRAAVA